MSKLLWTLFFEANALSSQNFKRICTNGASAMIDVKSGFVTLVMNEWPYVTSSHCSAHRHTLASKTLPLRLMEVMGVVIKAINFIRSRAKNYRFFQLFAKEMGTQHVGRLLCTKVCWLSAGKCLSRLNEIKNEVEIFLRKNKNKPHVQFHNEKFVVVLAYLADASGHLDDMNLSLQGSGVTVSNVKNKLAGLTGAML